MSDWALISESTASGASSVEFTDLTGYKIFKWVFIDIAHNTENAKLQVNFSSNGGSSYGIATTSTFFRAFHLESGSAASVDYSTSYDLANSTSPQTLTAEVEATGDTASASSSGCFHLYSPSSTSKVTHFNSRFSVLITNPGAFAGHSAGYANTTSAINALKFDASSGTFDGTIKQYGLVAT
jgi:hypothetical protein